MADHQEAEPEPQATEVDVTVIDEVNGQYELAQTAPVMQAPPDPSQFVGSEPIEETLPPKHFGAGEQYLNAVDEGSATIKKAINETVEKGAAVMGAMPDDGTQDGLDAIDKSVQEGPQESEPPKLGGDPPTP